MVRRASDHKPTVEEVRAARGKRIPDVLEVGLDVVFCGVNPGLYSGAVGFHFARPGNRFWPALRDSGFTDRILKPHEQGLLPEYGLGLTNLVGRATAVAAELSGSELRRGRGVLKKRLSRYRPRFVAVLGIGAYRTAFDEPVAKPGLQEARIKGVGVWLLPNPSGLNAHYQRQDLAKLFSELREHVRS